MNEPHHTGQKYQRRWWTLAVLSLSLVIIGLDNTILNVALPTLQQELSASASELQRMVDSGAIGVAVIGSVFNSIYTSTMTDAVAHFRRKRPMPRATRSGRPSGSPRSYRSRRRLRSPMPPGSASSKRSAGHSSSPSGPRSSVWSSSVASCRDRRLPEAGIVVAEEPATV